MLSVEKLIIIEEIKQLKARYFRLMDTKNWLQWRELFSNEIRLDVDVTAPDENGNVIKNSTISGADNVVSEISALLKNMKTVHQGHMFEIEKISDQEVTGVWTMEDIVESSSGKLHGYGHYHEKYIKEGDKWLISYLHLTRLRVDLEGYFTQYSEATSIK